MESNGPDFLNWLVPVVVSVGATMLLVLLSRRLRTHSARAMLAQFPRESLLGGTESAKFFGVRSLGMGQMRGNGILLLTADGLHFQMLVPKREFEMPFSKIVSVKTPKSFLGKSIFRPLLEVEFISETGVTDSMAWYVPDLEQWKQSIEKAAGRAKSVGRG